MKRKQLNSDEAQFDQLANRFDRYSLRLGHLLQCIKQGSEVRFVHAAHNRRRDEAVIPVFNH